MDFTVFEGIEFAALEFQMLTQFSNTQKTIIFLIGVSALAIVVWLWISNLQPSQNSEEVALDATGKDERRQITVAQEPKPRVSSQQFPSTHLATPHEPISDDTYRKIVQMANHLRNIGAFTTERYNREAAIIMTEGMDYITAAEYILKYGEAREYAYELTRKALAENPNDVKALLHIGNYIENEDEKIGLYRRVLELDPNSGSALSRLGRQLTSDDPHAAIEYLNKLEHLQDSPIPTPYTSLALAYERIGKYDEALKAYRNAYEADPMADNYMFVLRQIKDLEAGIYKVPLWKPETVDKK